MSSKDEADEGGVSVEVKGTSCSVVVGFEDVGCSVEIEFGEIERVGSDGMRIVDGEGEVDGTGWVEVSSVNDDCAGAASVVEVRSSLVSGVHFVSDEEGD